MSYEEFVFESIAFLENAKKRNKERLEKENKPSAKLHLEKEIEMYTKMQGFWEQEKRRKELNEKYLK